MRLCSGVAELQRLNILINHVFLVCTTIATPVLYPCYAVHKLPVQCGFCTAPNPFFM